MKTAKLTGPALDWAVAKCEGRNPGHYKGVCRATAHPDFPDSPPMFGPEMNYSTDWAQGGPIIERERITVVAMPDGSWQSQGKDLRPHFHNPTPLIAAMRCYVASKLGASVDLPDELAEATA